MVECFTWDMIKHQPWYCLSQGKTAPCSSQLDVSAGTEWPSCMAAPATHHDYPISPRCISTCSFALLHLEAKWRCSPACGVNPKYRVRPCRSAPPPWAGGPHVSPPNGALWNSTGIRSSVSACSSQQMTSRRSSILPFISVNSFWCPWVSLVRDQQCRWQCKKWNKKWEKANSLPPFILPTLLNLSQSPQQSWHHAVTYFVFLDGTELQALVHLPGTPKAFVANSSSGNHTLHQLFFSPGIPNVDRGS